MEENTKLGIVFLLTLFSDACASVSSEKNEPRPAFDPGDFIKVTVGDKRHLAYVTKIESDWQSDIRKWTHDYHVVDKTNSESILIRWNEAEFFEWHSQTLVEPCQVQPDNWPRLPVKKWQDMEKVPDNDTWVTPEKPLNLDDLVRVDFMYGSYYPCKITKINANKDPLLDTYQVTYLDDGKDVPFGCEFGLKDIQVRALPLNWREKQFLFKKRCKKKIIAELEHPGFYDGFNNRKLDKPEHPSTIENVLDPHQKAVRLQVLEWDSSQPPLHQCDIFPRLYEMCEKSGIVIGFGASSSIRYPHRRVPTLSSVLFFADFLVAEIEPIYKLDALTKRTQYPLKSIFLYGTCSPTAYSGTANRHRGELSLNLQRVESSCDQNSAACIAQTLHHEFQHFVDYGLLGNVLPSMTNLDDDPEWEGIDDGGTYHGFDDCFNQEAQPQMVSLYAASVKSEDRAEAWGCKATNHDSVCGPDVHPALERKVELVTERSKKAGVLKDNVDRAIPEMCVRRKKDAKVLRKATKQRIFERMKYDASNSKWYRYGVPKRIEWPFKIPVKTGEKLDVLDNVIVDRWRPCTWCCKKRGPKKKNE